MKDWESVEDPPKTKYCDVLLQLSFPDGSYDMYAGTFDNGKFEVVKPAIFEYPVNYFEGSFTITHWMLLPERANLKKQ